MLCLLVWVEFDAWEGELSAQVGTAADWQTRVGGIVAWEGVHTPVART